MHFMMYFFLTCLLGAKCHLYGLSRRPFMLGQRTDSKDFVMGLCREIRSLCLVFCVSFRGTMRLHSIMLERGGFAAGNLKEPGGRVELSGTLFGRFTSDSSKRNYRCEIRLKLETGPAVFWILEMLLSVGVFLRRTMAEYSWIIHVSQILCEASFKTSYFGNLKHIQKWKELHHESVVDLCFSILNFRAAVTNCQNLGGSTTEMYCLTVLKGRCWRCKCLGHASSGGAKKERSRPLT